MCSETPATYCCSIATASISTGELAQLLHSPYADDLIAAGTNAVLVDTNDFHDDGEYSKPMPGSLPIVVIAIRHRPHAICESADIVVDPDDPYLDPILAMIERHPIASTSLAVLLRQGEHLGVEAALAAESAVYSVLQSGPEFATWRATMSTRYAPPEPDDRPAAIAERVGDELVIELDRPHRHNAFSRSMRDALCEMLAVAIADETITSVHLAGRGPSFSSGGDLGEFGLFDDPATAHRTRLTRSPARLVHRLADRTTVRLHGNCMGAGIELPAFARRVIADPNTVIALPELELGLIPGAGGTVSLPRRIGRQATLHLALSGARVSASTALGWGLIDEVA
ncbi:MAG: enoyl-CoA hydratase/isomerase family protein [Ilumatobacteraceae bacterium]